MIACTTGKSLFPIELTRSLPVPGIVNTCSMMMVPVMISAALTARNVTTGIIAFFRICRRMMPALDRPRDLAVYT